MSDPNQLPIDATAAELNPFTPSLPKDSLLSVEGVKSYLGDQARTIREQHNSREAGETTFHWMLLTQLDKEQRWQLGAEGKFYHPTFGMMAAIYCQYGVCDSDVWAGAPVGMQAGQESPYVVTNIYAKSNPQLIMGLSGAYESPSEGDCGWVLTRGVNLQQLKASEQLAQFSVVGWSDSGEVWSAARATIGILLTPLADDGTIPPAALKIDTSGSAGGGLGDGKWNPVWDEQLTDTDALYESIRTLEERVTRNYDDATLSVHTLQRRIARITQDEAYLQLYSLQEVMANFLVQGKTAADESLRAMGVTQINLEASIQNTDTTRTYRDQTGYYATSSSIHSNEAAISSNVAGIAASAASTSESNASVSATNAGLSASAAQVSEVNASTSAGLASSYAASALVYQNNAATSASNAAGSAATAASFATVTAQVGMAGLPRNPVFVIWTNTATFPDYWSISGSVTPSQLAGGLYQPNYLRLQGPATGNSGGMIASTGNGNTGLATQGVGWYVIEADVRTNSSIAWTGAGVILAGANASNTILETATLNFATDLTVANTVAPASSALVQKWRKLVQLTNTGITNLQLTAANNNPIFSATGVNRALNWHRCSVRPATDSEIQARQASIDVAAAASNIITLQATTASHTIDLANKTTQISTNASDIITVSSNLSGLTGTVSTLSSNVSTLTTTSASHTTQIGTNTTNIATAAGQITTINSTLGSLSATVTTQGSTLVTQQGQITSILAKYVISVTAGDEWAGIELAAGTGLIPYIKLTADKLIFKTATTNQTPFEVSGDAVRFGTDIYVQNYKIIMDTGSVKMVQGLGFGSSNQFVVWFGPSVAISAMTESNGLYYLKTNGDGYFGGALSAGVFKNAARTTSLSGSAGVDTGDFGSNGGNRVVTVSYTEDANYSITTSCPVGPTTPSVSISLYLGHNSSGTLLTSQTINGSYGCSPGFPGDPGNILENIGGSFTYTDTSGGLTASYYAEITSRTLNVSPQQQVLGIISIES